MQTLKYVLFIIFTLSNITMSHAENRANVIYEQPASEEKERVKNDLQQLQSIEASLDLINDLFKIPDKLTIYVGGEEGPYYNGEDNSIVIPYGFVSEIEYQFSQARNNSLNPIDATQDVVMHTIFHEFAHALILMYDIPVLGKEEDAADGLAAVLLIESFEEGQEIALTAADTFRLMRVDKRDLIEEDFAGEHSFDSQRYYSTICQVFGSDPDKYEYLIQNKNFSEERADLCIEDYDKISRSWQSLLKPYLKEGIF